MGSDYNAPGLAIESHEKLTSWFCSVHSVLVWTQKQLVALGKHLWIEGITPSVSPTKSIGELQKVTLKILAYYRDLSSSKNNENSKLGLTSHPRNDLSLKIF